jgi:hypothetical protein
MSRRVFISSVTHAQEAATRLGDLAFPDTGVIDDGNLDASVVVVFATKGACPF